MNSLSVIVITKDEEKNIDDCLCSVKWADEIIVVDSNSTDKTIELAKKYTAKIFSKPWEGYGAAKNFALSKCISDWVLWLDADERVTPELQKEIKNVIAGEDSNVSAFSMPRKANFLGKWIKHCGWYPNRVVRLFKRTAGKFTLEKVHERLEINGEITPLNSDILHYTDPNLEHYYNKFNRYTSLAAEELYLNRSKFRLARLFVNPFWIFIKMYIFRLGFMDGIQGLILCLLSANYVFTKYAKLWEYSLKYKRG